MIYMTKYGVVYHSLVCKDSWPNIIVVKQYEKPRGQLVDRPNPLKMQRSAIKSLKAVETKLSKQIVATGTWRSCAYQWDLYREDPNRYAHPNTTLHTQGLAIDVNTDWSDNLTAEERNKFHNWMLDNGWHQARPTDEPWHWSYKLTA